MAGQSLNNLTEYPSHPSQCPWLFNSAIFGSAVVEYILYIYISMCVCDAELNAAGFGLWHSSSPFQACGLHLRWHLPLSCGKAVSNAESNMKFPNNDFHQVASASAKVFGMHRR